VNPLKHAGLVRRFVIAAMLVGVLGVVLNAAGIAPVPAAQAQDYNPGCPVPPAGGQPPLPGGVLDYKTSTLRVTHGLANTAPVDPSGTSIVAIKLRYAIGGMSQELVGNYAVAWTPARGLTITPIGNPPAEILNIGACPVEGCWSGGYITGYKLRLRVVDLYFHPVYGEYMALTRITYTVTPPGAGRQVLPNCTSGPFVTPVAPNFTAVDNGPWLPAGGRCNYSCSTPGASITVIYQ
jgi:hypothetical protein